jgi:hypothetical protein
MNEADSIRLSGFKTPTSRVVGAMQSALGVGECGREFNVLATRPLNFDKAGSAATLLQQEKNNSALNHAQPTRKAHCAPTHTSALFTF